MPAQLNLEHESDVYSFCSGRLKALYVNERLIVRPQVFDTAVGSMPKRCRLDTLADGNADDKIINQLDEALSGKKRRTDARDVVT